jgi:glucose/arabinose dehydrogenase
MYAKGGVEAITWTTGHRNPYGLVFAPDGHLWENEMGPKGGDELNLIEPGKNYGWPNVSWGDNYDGTPIPKPKPGDGYQMPVLYWVPSISPAGSIIYTGSMFPEWDGNYILGALSGQALVRITLSGTTARKADQWNMNMRIRDIAQAPDGAIWLIQDGDNGQLMRLTPKSS